ncbi:hypothetical protein SO802_021035 [Lithocarpus litseifolius]|uniref:Uncharacterized protein n=1 Tax=Lithocarpus litseifolius TaxID=425828 RepID=A0AAW2CHT3_9ROSI
MASGGFQWWWWFPVWGGFAVEVCGFRREQWFVIDFLDLGLDAMVLAMRIKENNERETTRGRVGEQVCEGDRQVTEGLEGKRCKGFFFCLLKTKLVVFKIAWT